MAELTLPTDGRTRAYVSEIITALTARITVLISEEAENAREMTKSKDWEAGDICAGKAAGLEAALLATQKFQREICGPGNIFTEPKEFEKLALQDVNHNIEEYQQVYNQWVTLTTKTDVCTCDRTRLCAHCSEIIELENTMTELTGCFVEPGYNQPEAT